MNVFVAGATGVAGRRAVQRLVAAGHSVTAVARSRARERLVAGLGAAPVAVDLFDPSQVRRAVAGQDAIVNLATKIPSLNRAMLPSAWAENNRIRTSVPSNLVDAALAAGAARYLQESLAFMYPDGGDRWIEEDVPVSPPRFARSTLIAEEQARRLSSAGGAGIVLRFGQFYASDAIHTASWVRLARRGVSPFIGPPDAFAPLIHADDVADAVVAALNIPSGTYNVVDDEPLRQGDLAQALSAALEVGQLRFAPAALVRLGGGKARMLMRSQRVSNKRFRHASGWTPRFSNACEGFRATLRDHPGTV